jgi:ABC-type molybdate transport system substrate-binding protein
MRAVSPTTVAVGSLVAFAGLAAALAWFDEEGRAGAAERPLIVYIAPTARPPLEAIRPAYERETGRRIELRESPSEVLLEKIRLSHPTEPADLFIPADDSYIRQARDFGLVGESIPVARIRGVILLPKGNPKGIASWNDLLREGVRVAVPNTSAAIGKVARESLVQTGTWGALEPHVVGTFTVTDAAFMTKTGGVDAALVWDAVARAPSYRGQPVLTLPELAGVLGRVEVAILKQSRDPTAARKLACYIAAADRGLAHFRAAGFVVEEHPRTWAEWLGARDVSSGGTP